jgi:hypothetical protein
MTVLFRPPNLNMAACPLRRFWTLKSLIWRSVVAMQQLVAYLLGSRPFPWANELYLKVSEMWLLAA